MAVTWVRSVLTLEESVTAWQAVQHTFHPPNHPR